MKKISQLFLILTFVFGSAQETDIEKILDNLIYHYDNPSNDTITFKSKGKIINNNDFRNYLKKIQDNAEEEKKFKGEISFGLTGLEANENSQFVISTGMNIQKGVFPFEFKLSSNIQAQTLNGVLTENVSNIAISFDYHFSDDLNKETFVFVKRTNNTFLGIDQRYEIGGGFLFNLYSGDNKNQDGLINNGEKLKKFTKNSMTQSEYEDALDIIYDKTKKHVKINEKGKKALKKAPKRYENVLKKLQSQTRFSILGGINYELEKTQDSLPVFYKDRTPLKHAFDATNRFRIVLRPGFEWKGENFTFESKAYFKFGVFGELTNQIEEGIQIDKRVDYWSEWITSLNFNFTKKIGLTIQYNLFYDNAPNRIYSNIALENEPTNFQVFTAEDRFSSLVFKFNYKL